MSAVVENNAPEEKLASTTELSVRGMTCQNCARHVREAIASVPGVSTASVDLDRQSATVRWSGDVQPQIYEVLRVVNAAGYEAKPVAAAGAHEHGGDGLSG